MKHAPAFSYAIDGRLLVGADGKQIVAYDGFTESPLWLRSHREIVDWVFVADDGLLALGATSAVTFEDDGTVEKMTEYPPQYQNPIAAAFTPFLSECAIAVESGVFIFDIWTPEFTREIAVRDVTNIELNDDGELLTISRDGTIRLFDDEGSLMEVVHGGRHYDSAAWALGQWWLLSGENVFTWDPGDAPQLVFSTGNVEGDELFVSEDSMLIGVRFLEQSIKVFTHSGEVLVDAIYGDRLVGAICFAETWQDAEPEYWVGIGLDLTDSNKINLLTGMLHRSDTHPEREHNSWMCSLSVDTERTKTYLADLLGDEFANANPDLFESNDSFESNDWSDDVVTGDFRDIIDAFHRKLVGLPDENIGEHLRNGPLPKTPEESVYAAQRTIALLEGASVDSEPGQSARIRLRAILRIMEPMDQTPEIVVCTKQIEDAIQEAERRTRNDTILGCGCLLLIAGAVIAGFLAWVL